MTIVYKFVRQLYQALPESALKEKIRWINFARKQKALLNELSEVPIAQSGCEELEGQQTPFVVLKDGTFLYGRWPTEQEREMYARWQDSITSTINENTIRVAIDVILRYLYPHAMPQLTMPYSRSARSCFHSQHIETIEDLPDLSPAEKKKLKKIYSPKQGESFLDLGAYMGYGDIRLSQELGPDAKIIAVEADSESRWLLEHNLRRNHLSNIVIIPKAIWNKDDVTLHLHKSRRQANSLITDMIEPADSVAIQTITVDGILKSMNLDCIDLISVTINGAEVEAIEGMSKTLEQCEHIRLSIAGWYKRDNQRICDIISPILREAGLEVAVGRKGGVLAWK